MSVDIRNKPHPHTPRKIRRNPPSPEALRDTPRPQTTSNPPRTLTGSPEATRNSGFVVPARDLASAKEASRRMNILADTISPRKLPEDRFNSIVRQLNYASTTNTNGMNGTHPREEQSVGGASNVSRPAHKKHPRKLSVSHSAERMNGFHSDSGG